MNSHRPKFAIAVVVAAVVVAAVLGAFAMGRGSQQTAGQAPTTKTTSSKAPPTTQTTVKTNAGPQWIHVPPATQPLQDTVAQRTMDSALIAGWNPQTLTFFDNATVPAPGYATGYSAVPVAWSPGAWIRTWTTKLLTIDFAHQTRAGLASWLSATRAQYYYPGLSSDQQTKATFAILFDRMPFAPTYQSGIPHTAQWAALAAAGTTWVASDVQALSVTSLWQTTIGTGWQPTDTRQAVYNVTGTITSTTGGVSTAHSFSALVTVGSAYWQNGYGTSYFSAWSES